MKHTHGTLSILSTTESLARAVEFVNPRGVEDLGIAGLVVGTKNGLTSKALGKRLSVTSAFADRAVTSFVLKLFKWKFSTFVLQTAHCISFSPTIFSALNKIVFTTCPKEIKGGSPPSETSGTKRMGAGLQNSKGIRAESADRTTRNSRLNGLKWDGIFDAERGFTEGGDVSRVERVMNVEWLSVGLIRSWEGWGIGCVFILIYIT